MPSKQHIDKPTIFAAALIVAVGGLIYELILGTAASYLFGDSIVSFSIATGVTLFGMGIGSLLSTKLAKRAGLNFIRNELLLSLIGGNSVLLLFAAFSLTEYYWLVFGVLSLTIGIFIGTEVPLLVGLLKEFGKKSSVNLLGKVLAADYFGALLASLLFPFVLLPHLGLMRTAYAVALINAAIGVFILWRLRAATQANTFLKIGAGVVILSLVLCLAYASKIERALDTALFKEPVVHYQFTPYQKIVVTQFKDDTRLYLSNNLQFSSKDEARYHETLAHSILTSVADPKRVLILGGGDGLLAREVLRYESVDTITLVDIDPAMTTLGKDQRLLRDLNDNSLNDPKVQVVNEDAFKFVQANTQQYDAILVDLVDPSNERIAKLYSYQFYAMLAHHIAPGGAYITQATSTYFTPKAFWQIAQTMQAATPDRSIVPLSQNVPSFGEWGFLISLDDEKALFARQPLAEGLRYHTAESLSHTRFTEKEPTNNTRVSTLLDPNIYITYQKDMQNWTY
jgi:spermidine synthase